MNITKDSERRRIMKQALIRSEQKNEQKKESTIESKCNVVSFFREKGGVGSSTHTYSYAVHAATRGLRTLIIDLDTEHHTTERLHIPVGSGSTLHSVSQLFNNIFAGEEAPVDVLPAFSLKPTEWYHHIATIAEKCGVKGGKLDIFVGSGDLEKLLPGLVRNRDNKKLHEMMNSAFNAYRNMYDLIVIDTPNAANNKLVCDLVASVADTIIMPINGSLAAYSNARLIREVTNTVRGIRNDGKVPQMLFFMNDYAKMAATVKSFPPAVRTMIENRRAVNPIHAIYKLYVNSAMCDNAIGHIPTIGETIYDSFKASNNRLVPLYDEITTKINTKNTPNVFTHLGEAGSAEFVNKLSGIVHIAN
jgi:cellulose biosynthesis protein BcsQ